MLLGSICFRNLSITVSYSSPNQHILHFTIWRKNKTATSLSNFTEHEQQQYNVGFLLVWIFYLFLIWLDLRIKKLRILLLLCFRSNRIHNRIWTSFSLAFLYRSPPSLWFLIRPKRKPLFELAHGSVWRPIPNRSKESNNQRRLNSEKCPRLPKRMRLQRLRPPVVGSSRIRRRRTFSCSCPT